MAHPSKHRLNLYTACVVLVPLVTNDLNRCHQIHKIDMILPRLLSLQRFGCLCVDRAPVSAPHASFLGYPAIGMGVY